jgi:predicted NAD/FAD-dependent oxidoreductase
VACALALHEAGIDVVVLDRGHRIGGRMASRRIRGSNLPYEGRVVDVGASYFTAGDPRFLALVQEWIARGVVRPWTDEFAVLDPGSEPLSKMGPLRYAAPLGLRSLVEDLAADLPKVLFPHEVSVVARTGTGILIDDVDVDVAVLAMPDAQCWDVLSDDDPVLDVLQPLQWDPVLALVAAYSDRTWGELDGAFVNNSAVLSFVADDGRRRGDDAPVLVAHSGSVLAARYLDEPARAIPVMLAELRKVMGLTVDPEWVEIRRWSLARPRSAQDGTFYFDGRIGMCGDAWGPVSRIETAWLSGDLLGRHIAAALVPGSGIHSLPDDGS